MKRIIPLCFLLFMFSDLANAQYFQQYFDGNDTLPQNSVIIHLDTSMTNIWQVGAPQKPVFDIASSIPNALLTDTINPYPSNNVSSFQFGVNLDEYFFNYGILAIQWNQKIDMEVNKDGGLIEYSVDTGATWVSVFENPYIYNFYGFNNENLDTLAEGQLAFTGTDSLWRNIWLCFDISWLSQSDSLLMRYTFQSDSTQNSKDGWMIDNLMVMPTIIHTVVEHEQEKYLEIHPNPTTGRVYISAKKEKGYHIIEKMDLMDINGKLLKSYGESPTRFFIDIGDRQNGTYLLKIKTNFQTETFKIILGK